MWGSGQSQQSLGCTVVCSLLALGLPLQGPLEGQAPVAPSCLPFYSVTVGVVAREGVVLIQTLGARGAFLRGPALLHGLRPHPPPGGVPALPLSCTGLPPAPRVRSWCPLLCMARFPAPFEGQGGGFWRSCSWTLL